MKKVSLFAAVLTASLVFPIAGAAQQPAAQAGEAQARAGRAGRPQLTDAQRDAIRKLHDDQREAGEAARTELRELHAQLEKALSAAQIDNGRVNELKGRIAQQASAAAAARIDQRAKVAALLTPEQRQAMGERGGLMLERAPRGGARGMRGAHGMGGHGMGGHVRRAPGVPGPRARGGQLRRGAPGPRGQVMLRQRGPAGGNDAQLRQRIEKLERELEELRRKIR